MKIVIYAAMLIAALMSVVMGVDLVNTAPVRIAMRQPVEIRHEAAPVAPAIPSPPPVAAQQPATQPSKLPSPSASTPQPAPPVPSVAQQPTPQIYQPEQTTAQSQEPPATCNVAACTTAYRSFTAADCTYQPSEGPRKLCTKK